MSRFSASVKGRDMWMPDYGLGHNVLMGLGYLTALGFPAILGIIFYFAIRSWPEGDEAANE
jgi:hypothetical protein